MFSVQQFSSLMTTDATIYQMHEIKTVSESDGEIGCSSLWLGSERIFCFPHAALSASSALVVCYSDLIYSQTQNSQWYVITPIWCDQFRPSLMLIPKNLKLVTLHLYSLDVYRCVLSSLKFSVVHSEHLGLMDVEAVGCCTNIMISELSPAL